jgi:hypothetical protein
MEQALSFIGLVTLCMVAIAFDSPVWFLITFFGGVIHLTIRGKKQGWVWPKRP